MGARLLGVILFVSFCLISFCSCGARQRSVPVQTGATAAPLANYREDPVSLAESFPFSRRGAGEIAPGFEISLSTPEDANLNGNFKVDVDGDLRLPYNIVVQAAGSTVDQLRSKITQAYRPFFRSAPVIQLSIIKRDYYVDVQGLVRTPGQYLIKRDSGLDEVIGKAGGMVSNTENDSSVAKYLRITQLGTTKTMKLSDYYSGMVKFSPEWQGGESLFLQSDAGPDLDADASAQGYIQLLGQVARPGEYLYRDNADFFYYLGKSGGPTSSADLDNLEVIRMTPEGAQSIQFSMSEVTDTPKLQKGDMVMVHAEGPNTVIPNTTSVIGAITGIFYTIFGL